MKTSRRVLFHSAAVAAVCWSLTACTTACPAVGWSNTATVNLEGNLDEVERVELCADGSCSKPYPEVMQAPSLIPKSISPENTKVGSGSSPDAFPIHSTRLAANSWKFMLGMSAPKKATVRALSVAGEVIAEQETALEWQRVGGSEQCGGPSEATPITLRINTP